MSILDEFVSIHLELSETDCNGELPSVEAVVVASGKLKNRFEDPRLSKRRGGGRCVGPAEVLRTLAQFTQDRPLIVFDPQSVRNLLNPHLPTPFNAGMHSLRDLSRAALPRLMDHRLSTLLEFFDIHVDNRAEGVSLAYQAVLDRLRSRDFSLLERMLSLISGTRSDLIPIFASLASEGVGEVLKRKIGKDFTRNTFTATGSTASLSTRGGVDGGHTLDVGEIRLTFEDDGPLRRAIQGYEIRPQQIDMAVAVAEAFNQGEILVAEGGTGVGKSMAYIVPAINFAVSTKNRVVISTNTKNLQEQLFFKDLPQLADILNIPFRYALLKGRSNYLCRNRWDQATGHLQSAFSEEERIAALPLVLWSSETETGDISENTGFDPKEAPGLWAKVCSDAAACRSQRCRSNGLCFANNARRAAASAHIIVVNHALLFSDLAADNSLLGDYRHLIVDEAHNVERVAAQYLGRELTVWRVRNLTSRLSSHEPTSTGSFPSLLHWLRASGLEASVINSFEAGVESAIKRSDALWETATRFFRALSESRSEFSGGNNEYMTKVRYKISDLMFDPVVEELSDFRGEGVRLSDEIRKLVDWMRDLPVHAFPNQDEVFHDLEGRFFDCGELVEDIDALTEPEDEGQVYWLEIPSRDGSIDVRIRSAPLDISDHLVTTLYAHVETLLFTSATIAIGDRLDYFLHRHGLDRLPEGRVGTLCVDSPFEYDRQALVCIPSFVPSPKFTEFGDVVAELLNHLVTLVGRGTLALFTSYGMLNKAYKRLKDPFETRDILLLGQGIDGPRSAITEQFKRNTRSVLFGTDSFWEGIDVPGQALEILVIVRLPFAVPSEPLVSAQMETLEKAGKDPFLHYSVPEAVLKFRQGFGRLIRNRVDRGVMVVLDSRVLKTSYGWAFLKSIPAPYRTYKTTEGMVGEIKQWFKNDQERKMGNKTEMRV